MADIGNTTKCARAGCGHPGSMHADTSAGDNNGKCSATDCTCTAFQTASASNEAGRVQLGTQVVGLPTPTAVSTDGPAFRATLIQEGIDTQDGRHIAPNALTWRELPLSLMVLTETGPGGHQGAVIGARIDDIQRVAGSTPGSYDLVGTGHLDTGDVGTEAARLIGNQTLRGVSGDLVDVESTVEVIAEDEDGWPTEIKETVTSGVLAAATVCPIPAFAGCTIELVDADVPEEAAENAPALLASGSPLPAFTVEVGRCLPCEQTRDPHAIVAAGGPMAPPRAWFNDPQLDRVTALTVTDDGRIFGHLAKWGECHIGVTGECLPAPHSDTNYAGYRLGVVRCADGSDVPTGVITLGGGHADEWLDAAATRAHYDDVATAVADVTAGEDAHGIWVAGALRPDVDDLTLRKLRGSKLSGDWRRIGGYFEMVAAHAVNVPGFPVSRVASGVPMSLVAAGARAVVRDAQPWRAEMDDWRRAMDEELAPLRAQRLLQRIRGE